MILHKIVYSRPWRRYIIAAATSYYVLLYIVIIIVGRDEKLDNRDESHNFQNISVVYYIFLSISVSLAQNTIRHYIIQSVCIRLIFIIFTVTTQVGIPTYTYNIL